MTTLQKTLVTATIAVATGAAIYAFQLQNQSHSLRQQQTALTGHIQQLLQERDDAQNQLAALQQENGQLRNNETELLKLRGEVTRLRHQQNVLPAAAQPETNNLDRVENTSIRLGTEFILFPTEALQALGVEWRSGAQGSRAALLTEQQFKVINEALRGASDVNLIGSPTVITSSGQKTQVSASKLVPAGGTNVNVGINLGVMPYFSTSSSTFNLIVVAELKQLVGDSSQPDVQTTQLTNQMNLVPGQTAVLEKEIPSDGWLPDAPNIAAGPRSLLVFVTPTIVDSRDYQRNGMRVVATWPIGKSPTNTDSPYFPTNVSDGKTSSHTSVDDKDAVLPGRHMSESQIVDIAFKELPQGSHLRCEFKDGVWEILEVQTGVWGVSSVTTNADGKVFVSSTNATRVVLRVRDADGKVEQIKTP
ncbi:MAG: hypothetical protein ABSA45_12350 [Verrucomicrobiota bacterium]